MLLQIFGINLFLSYTQRRYYPQLIADMLFVLRNTLLFLNKITQQNGYDNITSKDIDEFIAYVTHKDHFDSLKFYQLIHALQLLFTRHLYLEWSLKYDWDYLKASHQESPSCHSELMRQPQQTHSRKFPQVNRSSALEQNRSLFKKLTAVIRQMNYGALWIPITYPFAQIMGGLDYHKKIAA